MPAAPAPAVPTGGQASTITIPELTPQQPGVSFALPAEVTKSEIQLSKEGKDARAGLAAGRAATEANTDAAKGIAERAKQLSIEKAAEEERLAAESQAQWQAQEARDAAARKESQERVAAADTYLAEQRKEYESSGNITDYWANKSDGAKIMAAIAVGLSGIGAAMQGPGARNGAMDVIDKAMDRDFQIKKARAEKALQSVTLAQHDVGAAASMKLAADTEIRNQHVALNDLIQRKRATVLSRFGKTQAEIEGDAVIQGLEERKQAELKTINNNILQIEAQTAPRVTTSNAKSVAAVAAAAAKGREGGIYGAGGVPLGSTGDKTRDKEVSEQFAAYRDVDGLFDKLQKNFERHGTVNLDARARAEREQISKALAFKINRAEKLGTLDNSTLDLLKEMVPGGNWSVFTRDESALEKLRTLRESSRTSMRNTLDGAGLRGDEIMPALSPTKGEAPQMSPSERALRIAEINKRLMDPGEAEDTKVRLRAALEGLTRRGGG
jgi:hypothetical protein